jgi:hypothetical protein
VRVRAQRPQVHAAILARHRLIDRPFGEVANRCTRSCRSHAISPRAGVVDPVEANLHGSRRGPTLTGSCRGSAGRARADRMGGEGRTLRRRPWSSATVRARPVSLRLRYPRI